MFLWYLCPSQRLTWGVFLHCSLPQISRQHLTSNPELAESAVLTSQLVLGIPRLHVLCTRITGRPLPVLEDLIYSRHARAASTLPAEMFFQSSCWHLLMPLFQYFHIGNTQILDGTHSRYSTDHFILWFPALHIWITWRMLTGVRGPEHLHRDSNLIGSEWPGAGSKVTWLFWYLDEFETHPSVYFEEAGSQQCKGTWFRVCSLEVLLDWIPRALPGLCALLTIPESRMASVAQDLT